MNDEQKYADQHTHDVTWMTRAQRERYQVKLDRVDEFIRALGQVAKAEGEGRQPRENAVLCWRCEIRRTWSNEALCEWCERNVNNAL